MKSATGTAPDASQAANANPDASSAQDGTNPDATQIAEGDSTDGLIDGMSFEDLEGVLQETAHPTKRPEKKPDGDETKNDDLDDEDDEDDDDLTGGGDTVGTGEGDEDDKDKGKAGDDELDDGKPLPKNFRFHTEDPKMQTFLRFLRRNPDADPIAMAIRAGYTAQQAAAGAEKAADGVTGDGKGTADPNALPAELKSYADSVTTLEADLARITKEIKDAEDNYKPTGVLAGELATKAVALESAKTALRQAKVDHQEAAEWQREYEAENGEARAKAFERYPEAAKLGTVQYSLIRAELEQAETADPRFTQDPRYPLILLKRLEAKHPTIFKKKDGGKPIKEVVQDDTRQPTKQARALGETVSGNRGGPPKLSLQQTEEAIGTLSLDDLTKLADLAGQKNTKAR